MFGRATITLGIGPHSSYHVYSSCVGPRLHNQCNVGPMVTSPAKEHLRCGVSVTLAQSYKHPNLLSCSLSYYILRES